MIIKSTSSIAIAALSFMALCYSNAGAQNHAAELRDSPVLANLTLEQLSQITVTTASRRTTSLADTAAAVTVLTDQDIQRSGATHVAQTLRSVPGLNVAQINASEWAISSRGFNGRFSNKLLVMVDGRSMYTPLLAGVYWDIISPMLEDLDRIEVVRGSGASLWGANAVNGVINILSKSSRDTQGALLSGGSGTESHALAAARYGFALNDNGWMRVYANYHHHDDGVFSDGSSATDHWDHLQSGFRSDWHLSATDRLTLQGDYFTNTRGHAEPSISPSGIHLLTEDAHAHGANVLAKWTHEISPDSNFTLQSYYDHTDRHALPISEIRDTIEIDAQHHIDFGRNNLLWGFGYRSSRDRTTSDESGGFSPADYKFQLYEFFLQDEIELMPQHVHLTLGSKLEHNSFTGFELQPDLRLLWTPTSQQSYWTSVSRSTRTPNRADVGADINAFYIPAGPNSSNPSPLPLIVRAKGVADINIESVIAYQAGWRMQLSPATTIDTTFFYNDYNDLILGVADTTATFVETTPPPTHLVTPIPLQNAADGHSHGAELTLTWQPSDKLRITPSYSYLFVHAEQKVPGIRSLATLEDSAPRHQFILRTSVDTTSNLSFDLNLRWIDKVPAHAVDSYTEADLRIAWKIRRDIELSIVGQNLLHSHHNEFGPLTSEPRYNIQRSAYLKLLWKQR
jgi:iron complex outermembrane recepter protein